MPHDVHGQILQEGDSVIVSGKVAKIYPGSDRCNLVIDTGKKLPGSDVIQTITVTAELVEKVEVASANA